jgi:hypothetical protein
VFVPEQPWKGAWLGLDGSVPRAVPSDALTWLASQALPGDLVQKAVLWGLLAAAGLGMVRLTGSRHPLAGVAAATLYVWNPFVYGRLAIGHWAFLCGYASLPWTVLAARRLRDGTPGGLGLLLIPLAAAAWTSPTGGLIAAATAVAVALGGQARAWLTAVGAGVVVNLPWLLPGVLSAGDQVPPDRFGVAAFAARADTPWGALGSLLSFGGMWKESVDAPGRETWLLSGVGLTLTLLGVAGLWLGRDRDRRTTVSLTSLGAAALAVAWLPTTGPGADLFRWLVVEVPGGGLARDSHKWLAPFVLAVCWGLGRFVDRAAGRPAGGGHVRFWLAGIAVLPVLTLPSLAWGLLGRLEPVDYPDEWFAVRDELRSTEQSRTLVLPFSLYQRFAWNHDRAALDPAPRFFPGDVVIDDALTVRDGSVAGESGLAARVRSVRDDPEQLAELLEQERFRWLLVHRSSAGSDAVPDLAGDVVFAGTEITLVDLGNPSELSNASGAALIVAVDAATLLTVLLGSVTGWRARSAYTRAQVDEGDGGS